MAIHLSIKKRESKVLGKMKKKEEIVVNQTMVQKVGFVAGPILFLLFFFFVHPDQLGNEARGVLASTLWIAVWWVTEAIPIPVTSLMPLILFPLTGGVSGREVSSAYGDNIIFLFMGGFMLALAMERWGLHRRIALSILTFVGTSAKRIMLGFMLTTGFLSMWISNTASAMMMLPIGMAIIHNVVEKLGENCLQDANNFKKSMMLGIAYSASIGGVGTLIGTPPNIIFAGVVKKIYGVDISFAKWMVFGIPIAIVMIFITWYILHKLIFPMKIKNIPCSKEVIMSEKRLLGKIKFEEKAVMVVFLLTAFLWMIRPILNHFVPNLNDTMIALVAGIALFIIPSKEQKGTTLIDWDTIKQMPWGILLLFGGGLAIANGFMSSGLAEWIISKLSILQGIDFIVILFTLAFVVKFLTELTSNTATATMLLPIMASLSLALGVHPYSLMITACLSASMAFMLPVGTPPNAIVFGSNHLKMGDMVKAGFIINIISLFIIVIAVFYFLPYVWGIELIK